MNKNNTIIVIFITIILVILFSTTRAKEVDMPPTICTDYETYKTASTASIVHSAATYTDYMKGEMAYKDAELQTAVIYQHALRELKCDNIEESYDVLKILRNTRDAIPAGKLSSPAIANGYIDDAFNRIRVLNEDWGWDI